MQSGTIGSLELMLSTTNDGSTIVLEEKAQLAPMPIAGNDTRVLGVYWLWEE